jgi:hypothetical protein
MTFLANLLASIVSKESLTQETFSKSRQVRPAFYLTYFRKKQEQTHNGGASNSEENVPPSKCNGVAESLPGLTGIMELSTSFLSSKVQHGIPENGL